SNQEIVFSGDTTPCKTIQSAARQSDVLIHDCQGLHAYRRYFKDSHTSAQELGELAESAEVNTLVPFHHNLTEIPGDWNQLLEEIRTVYGGTIIYPRKGIGFSL
ncbi:MAG: MBL fold metallo-hydrolase, partial [bacterium]